MRDSHAGIAVQAVLFDMDGLLVDTEPLWFEVEHAIMSRLGGEWTEQDQRALIGGSLYRSVDYLLDRAIRQASRDQVAGWLTEGMAELLAEREVETMPGALELLAEVRAAGIPTALVTSSERVIMEAVLASLAKHDITFPVTVCGQDVRHPKPHPEPYLRAASLLSAEPGFCVALEDSPNGVAAAEAAGCVTVAVPGLAPIDARRGRLVTASLAQVDLELLNSLVADAAVTASPPG
jgi:HAD superfamily hydrolase (TIGR01509 family)